MPFAVRAFASGLFTGYVPVASGTVGSLLGLLLYALPGAEDPWILLGVAFVVFIFGVRASSLMERALGHDPRQVTVDEIVGMWVSLLFLPKSWTVAIAAFFLFRLLDIAKPFPARRFDRLSGGLGIMLVDVVAGLYTNLVLQVLMRVIHLP